MVTIRVFPSLTHADGTPLSDIALREHKVAIMREAQFAIEAMKPGEDIGGLALAVLERGIPAPRRV